MNKRTTLNFLFFFIISSVLFGGPSSLIKTPLNIVEVNAPAINCIFNNTCKVEVSDSVSDIPIDTYKGSGFFQTRTFIGTEGAPANGYNGYEYRIDLTDVFINQDIDPIYYKEECIRELLIHTGPVASFDYNNDGNATDQIYVVTKGGLGSIKLASATQDESGYIHIVFASPVCPNMKTVKGESTFFFGLASLNPPTSVKTSILFFQDQFLKTKWVYEAHSPSDAGSVCGTPAYKPDYWNNGPTSDIITQERNNCYNYANNKRTDTYAQPGYAADPLVNSMPYTCLNVTNAAIADGLTSISALDNCPPGQTKIAMVVDPLSGPSDSMQDYHWYRLDSDGKWTHKPGGTEATNLDNSGNPITNPEKANRCGGGLCYSDFCGYFCTCSDARQGLGHANIH